MKTAAGAEPTTPTNITNHVTVLCRSVHRRLQNFVLVWLDGNFDESDEDFKKSLQQLRCVVASIEMFTDAEECVKFLGEIQKEKVFMIAAGYLGRQVVPEIQSMPQLESVYVFCGNQARHEQWAKKIPKVKDVHTKIDPICEALQIDRQQCDRATIPIKLNTTEGVDVGWL
ncbi:unnamed protein product [Rotaria sordida]|uniref:Uncharacterized protein n=1 Tax=Rotaria sordida TaxID=392033 RepID=A0A814ZML7_9BILA|nr:unnamed protein product [Rotaria sordida]CAF3786107.1 unnamed protein product [Rotaria sordida]